VRERGNDGLKIPANAADYAEFADKMKDSEEQFKLAFEHA